MLSSRRPSPFAWIDGEPYVVEGNDLRRRRSKRLRIRRLSARERHVLEQALATAEREAWAQLEVKQLR